MATITLEGKEYQLDIEQAEQLGLLKEKDSRVRNWKEFVRKYSGSHGYSYNLTATMIIHSDTPIYTSDQLTQHEAKALAAFSKLLKLRRDWIGNWESDFKQINKKWAISNHSGNVGVYWCAEISHVLSFPTEQMAEEFLKTFRDLIEEAKILI